jgi:2-hydroxychromene-2-carboxylate isomerase
MNYVDVYFDFVSPYPWLASHQLDELRECTAAKFCFVPVLFAALLDHHSNMGPAEIPAKRRYTIQDTQRWAVHLGLKFKSPPAHPFNPLKPLRVTSATTTMIFEKNLRWDFSMPRGVREETLLRIVSLARLPMVSASMGKSF